jgi:phage-related protein
MNENLKIIISAETQDLKKNIDGAKKEVKSFKDQVAEAKKSVDGDIANMGKNIAAGFAGVVAGATAAVAGVYKFATSTAETADNIDKMSQKIGISRQAYQEWDYICSQCGVDVDVFKNGVKTLTTQMDAAAGGSEAAQETFKALGLTWEDGNGKLKSQEQMMEEAITALAGMEDGTERARLAQELFGKAGLELAPVLNSGVDGVEELRARCHELGLVMSDETIDAGVKLGDTIADVKDTFGAITDRLGAEFMPIIQNMADKILEFMPQIEAAIKTTVEYVEKAFTFAQEHQGLLITIAAIIGTIVTAVGLYNAVAAVKAAMDAAQVTTLGGLIAAHIAHAAAVVASLAPYIAIVAAIAAVIAIIVLCVKHWDKIKEAVKKAIEFIVTKVKEMAQKVSQWFNDMKEKMSQKIQEAKDKVVNKFNEIKQGIQDKIQAAKQKVLDTFNNIKSGITDRINAIKSSVTTTMENVKNAMLKPIEKGRDLIKGIIDKIKGFFSFTVSLPHIKLPHFTISPSGWSVGDLLKGSIPRLGISWYAKGGIFDKPTLFGYGNGMLGGLGENGAEAVVPLEKNTQWLTRIADMLATRMGNNQPIVLQVDGKTFAEVAVSSINDLTKLRGSLPLKIM